MKKYNLKTNLGNEISTIIENDESLEESMVREAFEEDEIMINSNELNGKMRSEVK